jgi:glutathione S-transferase
MTGSQRRSFTMKLFEFPPTRSIRVRWMLQELGVPFEAVTVNMLKGEHKSPAFLEVNPAGKLPALADDGVTLTESIAIVLYLAEKYPEKGFLPRDPAGRAEVYRWLMFAATELEQPLWRIAHHTNIYPESKRLPAEIALARDDFKSMAAVLEQHMKARQFVAGNSVTVADFVLAYTLDWANEIQLLDDFPGLRAYLERMYARPHAPMRIAKALASVGL